MPLVTNPDGSHSFIPDLQQFIAPDLDSLNAPRNSRGQVRALAINDFVDQPLGPQWPGAYYFRWTLREGRGGIVQDAFFNDPEASGMSSGEMVFDRDGIARLSFMTNSSTSNQPDAKRYGGRFYGADFLGVPVFAMPEDGGAGATRHLFKDNGTAATHTPSIVPVTGFSAPAGALYLECMETIQVGNTQYLAMGWDGAAAQALVLLSDLANPPTTTSVGLGANAVYGLCQVEIDGNSVQAYTRDANGGLIRMFNTNVGVGSVTIVDRCRIPVGGYTVGLGNIGYNPQVYYVVPKNGNLALDPYSATTQTTFYDQAFRGKLVSADLRAFELHDVKTVLDHVRYATLAKYGIFYCNGRQHQYLTAGSDFPVDSGILWPANSDYQRVCRGHWVVDDRIFWLINRTSSSGVTIRYVMEFDTVTYKVRQWSLPQTPGTPDVSTARYYSAGGPRLPFSELTRNLIDHAGDRWYYQYVNRSSEIGWDQRHTVGADNLTGAQFEDGGAWVTPRCTIKGKPGAKFVVRRVTGPSLRNLRAGGTDSNSRMTIAITGQPEVEFRADESDIYTDRRPVAEEQFRNNNSWTYELQADIRGFRMQAGSDVNYDRYSGNYAEVVIEGFYYDEPVRNLPDLAEMQRWDSGA